MRRLNSLWCWTLGLLLAACLSTATAAGYALGPDDRLIVRVSEWPDLTGEFAIGADGRISLPIVGDIPASGLQLGELAASIAQNLQQRANLRELPSVILEMKQYRPFYILGDVQRPGEYPFRPGLTALQAVSIAGGYFRFTDPGLLRLERDVLSGRGQLRSLALKADQLAARRARLLAEIEGRDTIDFPAELMQRQSETAVAELLREQALLLETHRNAIASATKSFREQISLFEDEIKSLGLQIDTEKRQLRAVQREMDDMQSLAARGLAQTSRLVLLERTVAQILGQQQGLETTIVRARQNISQTEQKINDLKSTRRQAVTAELEKTNAELNDTRQQIATTEQLLIEAEVTAPTAIADRLRNAQREVKITITRPTEKGSREIEAEGLTAVEPGDVVRVDLQPLTSFPSSQESRTGSSRTGSISATSSGRRPSLQ